MTLLLIALDKTEHLTSPFHADRNHTFEATNTTVRLVRDANLTTAARTTLMPVFDWS